MSIDLLYRNHSFIYRKISFYYWIIMCYLSLTGKRATDSLSMSVWRKTAWGRALESLTGDVIIMFMPLCLRKMYSDPLRGIFCGSLWRIF